MRTTIAAAVCYRLMDGSVEFLLVRTKGGKRWTFPKGHVKSKVGEMAWQAAAREAEEEAGVTGVIEQEPFTRYAYYKGEGTEEETVEAYLMLVESARIPDEPFRKPTWFTQDEAVERLAERRTGSMYASEHERVVREAVALLTS